MKASELADHNFTGPVRLKRGHDVYTSVSWTQGAPGTRTPAPDSEASLLTTDQPKEPQLEFVTGPKMVRLTRLKGEIGNCTLDVRYVTPDAELEPVVQIIGFDQYQTAVISESRPPEDRKLECSVLGFCAAVGGLAATHPPMDPTAEAEYLSRLGDVCWHIASIAYDIAARLSAVPRLEDMKRDSQSSLVGIAGELAGITRNLVLHQSPIEAVRAQMLDLLAGAIAFVRLYASEHGSDIFAVMSVDISRRLARKSRCSKAPHSA